MASIGTDPNGRKRILFVSGDGSRKTIRLGKADRKQAEAFRLKLEKVISANITGGAIDDETSRWLAGLDEAMHERLASVGLVLHRNNAGGLSLGGWMDEYFAAMVAKPNTFIVYGQVRRNLLTFFGADKPMKSITPADGDQWRRWLVGQGLAENTIARRVKAARTFFRKAVKRKVIADNPFADVRTGVLTNKAKQFFITRDMADAVLSACPDDEWRLIFALGRFGGLRCPSEVLSLRWTDVLWDKDRIRVPSPKTEHHAGGECRIIPMFPEIRTPLLNVFEKAQAGGEFVITRYRQANCNLRTQLERIIRRAGLQSWPRPFHNLRASRETELAEQFPIQTVCQWIGNSVDVARKHYLQVTDEHFARAIENGAKSAAQNPAQYTAKSSGMEQKPVGAQMHIRPDLPSDSAPCDYVLIDENAGIGATGNRTPIC